MMDPILATWIDDLPALPAARDATPIDDFRDRAILHCNGLQDGGGHLIEAWSSLQGNTTWVRVWKVDHTSGARTPLVDVAPPAGFKLDDFSLWQAGAALIVGIVAHEAISDPARRNIYARAVVPGVLVPYPTGAEPRGAGIDPALLGGGGPPPAPQPGGVTVDEIITAIKAEMGGDLGDLVQKRAKNGSRQGIQLEVTDPSGVLRDVPTPAYLRTPDAVLTVLKDGLAPFVRDRAFEGATEALRKAGFPPKEGDNSWP